MEEDERGLRSGEEEARIEDLEKEKGKRRAAEEGEGFERECLGREMPGERAEEVKSCRDCVIVKGNREFGEREWENSETEMEINAERRRCQRREELGNCRRKIDGPKRLKPLELKGSDEVYLGFKQ